MNKILLTEEWIDLTGLEPIVRIFAQQLSKKDVVLLSGPVGIGKTEFVRTLLRHLGVKERITSPTYSLHHQFETTFVTIDHFDLYRLNSVDEILSSGILETFEKSSGLVLIEWSLPNELWPLHWNVFQVAMSWNLPHGRKLQVIQTQKI